MYLKNDPYEYSDAVFGVKNTLVITLKRLEDEKLAQEYGVGVGCALMEYEFVMVTKESALELRHQNASDAMLKHGKKMQFLNGLPVPDVD